MTCNPNNSPTPAGPEDNTKPNVADIEVKSLLDVMEKSEDFWQFCEFMWYNPWVMFVWFHWW